VTTEGPRILYSFPHVLGASGIGTTALNQIRALREAGAEVVPVVAATGAEATDLGALTTLQWHGVRIPHRLFGRVDTAYAWHDRAVARLVDRSRFDVVHTWPLGGLLTLRAARERGVLGTREAPNSHTAHAYVVVADEAAALGVPLPRGQSHRPDLSRLRREFAEYEAAAVVFAPSEHVRQTFLDHGVAESKLVRHRYGYDPTQFYAASPVGERPFRAVFLGSADPRKGLHYALRAWRQAGAPGELLIAGGFAPGYREVLSGLLDQPGVRELGFVARPAQLLRDCDVLLLPSVEEGSALVSYEAMASGCVPLVSTTSGAPVADGRDGLLHAPGDVGALAGQLHALSSDRSPLDRLRAAALVSARDLSWAAAGRVMRDAILEQLSATPRRQ
jgi:glycosyltransferase involved in cell wall biosynthesis